jgi:hypothetical protein
MKQHLFDASSLSFFSSNIFLNLSLRFTQPFIDCLIHGTFYLLDRVLPTLLATNYQIVEQ